MEVPYSTTVLLQIFSAFTLLMKLMAVPTYDIVELGAKPDGMTDSKSAFQKAWGFACGSSQPACINVPEGTFLLHQVNFEGPCNSSAVFVKISGSIVAPDYTEMEKSNSWIVFMRVDGVFIEGGNLDGKGSKLWQCKASSKNCPDGATTLAFYNSSNVNITGLTSQDSEKFHIDFVDSQHIKLQKLTISAQENSPNTDGIHLDSSADVSILHSSIGTGDDCISIGPGSSNLWIEDVYCGPGHGISIGSLGWASSEEGVNDVTVKNTTFKDTQNGVRIKTWARPCQSFVRTVLFQDAIMTNVENPILIDQHYCPGTPDCPGQSSGVNITDVRYTDIHGTSATEVAMKFDCSDTNPCTDLRLADINLTYNGQPAKAWCSNASGKTSGTIEPKSCFHEGN